MANQRSDQRLILWDIDHTLIESRGVGSALYRTAFEEITGRTMQRQADVTGKTEPAILAETLRLHGIEPSDSYQRRYAQALATQYEQHTGDLRQRGRALPGARAVLAALAGQAGIVQSVLTGNLRAVAAIKLAVFDLDEHLDLEVGAYGDDSEERSALVPLAQQRAGTKYRQNFAPHNTIIIGDSTHDIHAAHQGGAAAISVTTGSSSTEDLRSAGALIVLPDLTDTAQLLKAVMQATAPDTAGAANHTS